MRKILFRGKFKGSWEYGFLSYEEISNTYYIGTEELKTPVDPNTVGQFTGLTDKNGTKIFEGDILRENSKYGIIICEVLFIQTSWIFKGVYSPNLFWNFNSEMIIIGNIHDNPELLDEKA